MTIYNDFYTTNIKINNSISRKNAVVNELDLNNNWLVNVVRNYILAQTQINGIRVVNMRAHVFGYLFRF